MCMYLCADTDIYTWTHISTLTKKTKPIYIHWLCTQMFYRHRLAYAHIYFLHLILAKRPRSDHIYFFKNMHVCSGNGSSLVRIRDTGKREAYFSFYIFCSWWIFTLNIHDLFKKINNLFNEVAWTHSPYLQKENFSCEIQELIFLTDLLWTFWMYSDAENLCLLALHFWCT